jgi:hypothetical protein
MHIVDKLLIDTPSVVDPLEAWNDYVRVLREFQKRGYDVDFQLSEAVAIVRSKEQSIAKVQAISKAAHSSVKAGSNDHNTTSTQALSAA